MGVHRGTVVLARSCAVVFRHGAGEGVWELQSRAGHTSYGWGVLPVYARIGRTEWQTSLFPKDGRYLVPVKARVRTAEQLEEGDTVTVTLTVPV